MPNRYLISPLVQDDKGRWVPSIKLSAAWTAQQASGADMQVVTGDFDANGQPVVPWCLCAVKAADHAALAAVANVDLLPDFPLDAKVNAMHGPTKLAMRARMIARGVASSVMDNADGFRDVIEGIARGRLNNAGFNADSFAVL